MVQIIEIIGRAIQGVTKPFICRADDGNTYFVKGVGAGRSSQIYEWVAGNLGRELGLEIAPFEIVDVPEELIEGSFSSEFAQLGAGPAFGSCKQQVMELSYSAVAVIPDKTQLDLLMFDWWIRNNDRTLTERSGNPNLFWNPETESLIVIDHNQAFDVDFSRQDFLDFHVFRGKFDMLAADLRLQDSYAERLGDVLQNWQSICDTIPEEWFYVDQEQTVATNVNLDSMYEMLSRYNSNEFWSVP